MAKMIKCKTCGADIAKSAKVCPHCGAKNKKFPLVPILIVAVILFFAVAILGSDSAEPERGGGYSYSMENPKYAGLSREEYMSQCVTMSYGVSYTSVARNPDYYEGQLITTTGKVIQVLENGQEVQLRLQEETDNWEDDYVWYVFYTRTSGEPRILEGDTMTIYGENVGTVSYETVMGNIVTIPAILMKYHT